MAQKVNQQKHPLVAAAAAVRDTPPGVVVRRRVARLGEIKFVIILLRIMMIKITFPRGRRRACGQMLYGRFA